MTTRSMKQQIIKAQQQILRDAKRQGLTKPCSDIGCNMLTHPEEELCIYHREKQKREAKEHARQQLALRRGCHSTYENHTTCEHEQCGLPKPPNGWGLCAFHMQQKHNLLTGAYNRALPDEKSFITREQLDDALFILSKFNAVQRMAISASEPMIPCNPTGLYTREHGASVMCGVVRAVATQKYVVVQNVRDLEPAA